MGPVNAYLILEESTNGQNNSKKIFLNKNHEESQEILQNGIENQDISRDSESLYCSDSEEDSDWEYYSDEDDDEPMLVAEPYKPTLVPKEKFQDPYCKYKYLDMDPDMEVLVQLQAWISKMRDVKYCLGIT